MGSKRNRQAGNKYEVDLVNELKSMAYSVVTSRSESRNMDNKKVDVFSPPGTAESEVFPYYIQAKFTSVSPSYATLLSTMPSDRPGLVFHKKAESYKCKDDKVRHRSVGEFVIMTKELFYELLKRKTGESEEAV